MNKNKQLAVNMIAQIIGFLSNIGISLLLTPIIVRKVGSEAYGFVGLANNFVSYAQIVVVALNSMASRFITIKIQQKRDDETNRYFTSVVFSNIIISLIMVIPATIIVIKLDKIVNISNNILIDVRILWTFVFLNFFISIISATFSIATFVRNKLYYSSIGSIISNLIRVLILFIAFSFFAPSVWYLGLAATICTIYNFLWNFYLTKKLLPQVKISNRFFDLQIIKTLISSGIWNSVSQISFILTNGLDLLITNLYVGPSGMGILSISKTIPGVILSLFKTLASVYAPQLTISYANNNYEDIKGQILSSMKVLAVLSTIIISIMFIYGDVFYSLWVPTQNSKFLVTLSIMACIDYIFSLPEEVIWNVFTVTNKVKNVSVYMLSTSLLNIVIVLITLNLVDTISLKLYIIAGTSAIFSLVRSLGFIPLYGAKCLQFKWNIFYPIIIKSFISTIIISLISIVIRQFANINNWISFINISIFTTIIGLIINIFIILDSKEREAIYKMIKVIKR